MDTEETKGIEFKVDEGNESFPDKLPPGVFDLRLKDAKVVQRKEDGKNRYLFVFECVEEDPSVSGKEAVSFGGTTLKSERTARVWELLGRTTPEGRTYLDNEAIIGGDVGDNGFLKTIFPLRRR